ncbi:MAG TPA: tripartite tricarboxylate transporter TctB family protein [Candidatus Binatia bacterium]|nr:tripartite tricarboxylate transporter TctB family protein [Candidatus Binatia bacterium]
MVSRDVAVAGVALAFGAAAAFESAKLPFGTVHSPGQGFFPWWISAVILLLALLLLAQALTSRPGTGREAPGRIAKVAALLVVLAGYTFLLEPLGYPLCTFFLVLFMLRVTDPQRWAIALGMAAITAVGSYGLFAMWLNVPLPRGPL